MGSLSSVSDVGGSGDGGWRMMAVDGTWRGLRCG